MPSMIFLWGPWAAASDLSGTWRVDLHLVHDVRVPVLGKSRSDSHTVQLWEVADSKMKNRHCSIRAVTRRRIGRPTLPDAFVAHIPHTEAPIEIDGKKVRVDLGVGVIGFTGDTVPTEADDPNLTDHEGDGQPGATISVWAPLFGDVSVYIAQRTHLILDGTIDGEVVTGSASQVELVQNTVGAANRLFAQQAEVVPVLDESTFRMTRVVVGTGCADDLMAPLDLTK